MRQTSRAVALLLTLESANAALRPIVSNIPALATGVAYSEGPFNAASSTIVTGSVQQNSRTAGYTNRAPNAALATQDAGAKWNTATIQKAKTSDTNGTSGDLVPGSGCMQCINAAGVWCSRTYSYLASGTAYMYEATAYASGQMGIVSTSDAEQQGGDAKDQGACCETALAFSEFIGTIKTPAATYTAADSATCKGTGASMVDAACPAIFGAVYDAGGGTASLWTVTNAKLDNSDTVWTSWWCSNGLYKKATASTTVVLNAQQIIPQGVNKRQELAQIGCPQIAARCGISTTAGTNLAFELTAVAATKEYIMPESATLFTVNDKCTWVAYSAVRAPTFTMADGTSRGLTAAAYIIHNMEYTANSSWTNGAQSLNTSSASSGYQQMAPALSLTTMLPLFWMPAAQFSSLRTWYAQGATASDAVTGMPSNWMSPGMAAIENTTASSLQLAPVVSQLYGNVANVPMAGNVVSTSTTALGATENYGKYNSNYFDLRQMRYFPAKVAQTVHASGTALALQYTTALGTYNTAKTTWDAYVAILEKNAKQDAFAAMFSPPKAPTVPPLPNMPWAPAAYSGYVRATAQEVKAYAASGAAPNAVASPTAQQFWTSLSASQVAGGWGSFTAQLFYFRNGWGKSFGTIGYSGDANREKMSDVWKYEWSCSAESTTTPSTTSQCADTYTVVAGSAATVQGRTAPNAINMVSVVSLWSTANALADGSAYAKAAWSLNGFKLTFNGSAWQSAVVALTAIPASTPAVAAKSLTGIAGAQALAATSAAALAVAAALY